MATRDPAVGFVGLGLMGEPMALNLRRAGLALTVWNRSPAKARALVEAGAVLAPSPAEVARQADVIFLCVLDTAAVEAVLFGDDGIAAGGAPGKIVVDHSTILPKVAAACATRLRAEHGMGFVDAPVTGGQRGAIDGSLRIFAGGAAGDVEAVRPPVLHMARDFIHVGDSGAGQMAKLCNQTFALNQLTVMAEMIKLAEAGGLDSSWLPELLRDGLADSAMLRLFCRTMAARDDTVTARLTTMQKDLDLISTVANEAGVAMPVTAFSRSLTRLGILAGLGEMDFTALIRLYDKQGAMV